MSVCIIHCNKALVGELGIETMDSESITNKNDNISIVKDKPKTAREAILLKMGNSFDKPKTAREAILLKMGNSFDKPKTAREAILLKMGNSFDKPKTAREAILLKLKNANSRAQAQPV